jgi:hypothetical protein
MQHKEMLMKSQFFDQKIFNNLEGPMQKLMELNVKTMQNLAYMKPMELFSIKKPEELLEKHMEIIIGNSHMFLNYMRDTFSILESHWLNVSRSYELDTKNMIGELSSATKKSVKMATNPVKGTAKKTTAPAKSATKKTTAAAAKSTVTKVAAAGKKADIKKNMKGMPTKPSVATKAKQETKDNLADKAKSNIQLKESMGVPKVSTNVVDKSNVKDVGIQSIGKGNPLPN